VPQEPSAEPPTAEPLTDAAPALRGPVMMAQRWVDVAFLHWALDPARVAPLMPPGVRPDVRDGVTWVGLVPFRMVGAGLGRGPAVPWAGTFLETNVRFYSVDATGRRGIVFASLDADRLLVVAGARAAFGLPYRWSRITVDERTAGGQRELLYRTTLRRRRGPPAGTRIHLRVGPEVLNGDLAGLPAFLTNRWGLHEQHLGRTWYVPNEHEAWPLQAAQVLGLDDQLLAAAGLPGLADRQPDHVAFSAGVTSRFGYPNGATAPRR